MCDEETLKSWSEYLRSAPVSRRRFGAMAGGAGLVAALPKVANAQAVAESDVGVQTPDGVADCYFVHPTSGTHPGVIVWPDILGLRTAFRQMGRRLAESGYSVLVVNPFYRDARAPVVAEGATFQDPEVREKVMAFRQTLSPETDMTDARAFVDFLDEQSAVASDRKMGTTGYCMGGPMVMHTAYARADRVGAGATFHGGGLATNSEDSPHLLIDDMDASFLIAIAANDDQREPEAKNMLRQAFDAANLDAEIEVYEGTQHGWCPPDSAVYDEAQAERAWSRLLALFDRAL
jgi:carboxymethylenebutenolidase